MQEVRLRHGMDDDGRVDRSNLAYRVKEILTANGWRLRHSLFATSISAVM